MKAGKSLKNIRQYYLANPHKKKLTQTIAGYFIIPMWFLASVSTTIFLVILFIIAPFRRGKKEPYFKFRSIFPEE